MASRTEIKARLEFWQSALTKLRAAYIALLDGGVKSYTIDDRQITRLDLSALESEIEEAEEKVDELTALLENQKPRKMFGVIARDW